MSKYRYVKSDFWVDEYIEELSINEKFLFLYFLTNPQTNILGIYKSSVKRINFETGLQKIVIESIIEKFSKDDKIHFISGHIIIVNFQKHQNPNDMMKKGIKKLIGVLPLEVLEFLKSTKSNIYHRLYIGYYKDTIDYVYLHINKNININKNKDEKEPEPEPIKPPKKKKFNPLNDRQGFLDNMPKSMTDKHPMDFLVKMTDVMIDNRLQNGKTYDDYYAGLRTFIRNASKFGNQQSQPNQQPKQSLYDQMKTDIESGQQQTLKVVR